LTEKIKLNQPAPDFTLENTQDEPITISNFQGEKNVFLVFNRGFF